MEDSHQDVSKIHKRYKITLLNPSSRYHSLIFSALITTALVSLTVFLYLRSEDFLFRLSLVFGALFVTQFIDSRFIKNKEYSKSLHMSLFGNTLWILTVGIGYLSFLVLSRDFVPLIFITEGMFLFASFRIGILTTTLGVSLKKAWMLAFIQPLAMYLALVPMELWSQTLLDFQALAYGAIFLSIASVWSVLTDRAGRPGVKSTHRLVQAYLASLSQDVPTEVESILDERSKPSRVSTSQIRLRSNDKDSDFRIVLPEIHPGPFHPVGGSNIPYLIYKNLDSSAMVMHSVSNHSLNLPSRNQVEKYLQDLSKNSLSSKGVSCTEPVTIQVNKARVVGLRFGTTCLLFLSLSPHGMEDIPLSVKKEIEQFSKNRSFDQVLIVDCHNAMGTEISPEDSEDLLNAAKSNLDTLLTREEFPIEFGYANSKEMNLDTPDLAMGGIGILCLRLNNKKYFLGWADANNMENGVREEVVNHLSEQGYDLIEICTSDTHYSSTPVRNRNGYYQFGIVTQPMKIANWYLEVAKKSAENIVPASFEILENETEVKVMGQTIFEDYSRAVENSMKISKIFLIGCAAFFVLTMFL